MIKPIFFTGLLVAASLALVGCGPEPTTTMAIGGSDRVSVARIAVIKDDLAYRDRRGVYIITDTKTGQEFIGVSGVGISQTGSHMNGKTSVADEQ